MFLSSNSLSPFELSSSLCPCLEAIDTTSEDTGVREEAGGGKGEADTGGGKEADTCPVTPQRHA